MKKVSLILVLLIILVAAIPASGQEGPDIQVPDDVLAAVAQAKGTTNTYVVLMEGLPAVAYEGDVAGLAATKPEPGEKINPADGDVQDYIAHLQAEHDLALALVGGAEKKYDFHYTFNGFAADLTEAQAEALLGQPGVLNVWEDTLGQLDTVSTPDFLGLTDWNGLWNWKVNGEGVVIGIIDSGIWPESESFANNYVRKHHGKHGKMDYNGIQGWDGECMVGEEFTAEDCNGKIVGARWYNSGWGGDEETKLLFPHEYISPRDWGGHGTHTASTAGGNRGVDVVVDGVDLGKASGIAPRARIAVYKVCWDVSPTGGCWSSDSVAAIEDAIADGVDVINFSISGSRTSFRDPVEIAFLYAADAGIFVAASAGNSGPTASTVAHNSPWLTTVAAGTHDRYYGGTATLGNGDVYNGASIDSRGAGPADLVYSSNVGLTGANATEVRLCYPGTLDPAAVAGKIVVCDRGTIARVDKSLAVSMADGVGMILANVSPSSINADLHFVPTVHVDEIDGAVIRAYAQTAGATATLTGGIFEVAEAPAVASFSSRGPALASTDLLKPDIMAPGVDILAAVAPPGNSGRDYDFYSGTSMSSPHIAGVGALMTQAHPKWSPAMIKSAIMTTASQTTNEGNPIPGNPFGYGAGQVVPNDAVNPGLVYDAGWDDYLDFIFGDIDPSDLNYPSITIGELAGSQTIVRTVTNVGRPARYKVSIDAPPGVDVTVTPSRLFLGRNQSATYEVTFTVTDAPLNEYAFGSLTWSDRSHHGWGWGWGHWGFGGHEVRSPLTVRPVALAAPTSVSSDGSDVSYDVTFGYTGDFSATPRGLVPALTVDDSIFDDDQLVYGITFPAGLTYARFSLFDENVSPASDLDLYLFNSAGQQIASSGGSTSAEEINVVNPAEFYYVLVLGYQTANPTDFTLFVWGLDDTDAGNMTVTAPAAAVLGDTATIDLSFSGLTPGVKYLGSVAYDGAAGLPNPTIVRVDP